MPQKDWLILIAMGGAFIILGLVTFLWGKSEERKYYESLASRTDVREYLEHWPSRPEPGALKIGGWIAIAIGVLMVAVGGIFLLLG